MCSAVIAVPPMAAVDVLYLTAITFLQSYGLGKIHQICIAEIFIVPQTKKIDNLSCRTRSQSGVLPTLCRSLAEALPKPRLPAISSSLLVRSLCARRVEKGRRASGGGVRKRQSFGEGTAKLRQGLGKGGREAKASKHRREGSKGKLASIGGHPSGHERK